MAKTSTYGAASALGGTEQMLSVQGGATKNITPAQIKTYVGAPTISGLVANQLVYATSASAITSEPLFIINTSGTPHYIERLASASSGIVQAIATLDSIAPDTPRNYGKFTTTIYDGAYSNPDGRYDTVHGWGWNQDGAGGAINALDDMWSERFENHYTTGGTALMEKLWEWKTTATYGSKLQRVMFMTLDKHTGSGGVTYRLDGFNLYGSYTGAQYFTIDNHAQTNIDGDIAYFSIANVRALGALTITPAADGNSTSIATAGSASNNLNFSAKAGAGSMGFNFGTGGASFNMSNTGGADGIVIGTQASASSSGTLNAIRASVSADLLNINFANSQSGKNTDVLITTAGTGLAQIKMSSGGNQMWLRTENSAFSIVNITLGTYAFSIKASNSNVGIGNSITPTARLHIISAGTTTAGSAPLKLTSGTNMTTAEAGAFEYDGTNLFFTRSGTTRENVLVAVDNASAPSTTATPTFTSYYGGNTKSLGDPNRWASVNILGSVYKIPLFT